MNKTWLFHLENTTCLSPSRSSLKTSGGPIMACMLSNRLTESGLRHHLHHFFFFFSDGLYATRDHRERVSRPECYCKRVEMAKSFIGWRFSFSGRVGKGFESVAVKGGYILCIPMYPRSRWDECFCGGHQTQTCL